MKDLEVFYNNPDANERGAGKHSIPMVAQALDNKTPLYWMMSPAEQIVLIFLLAGIRPKVAIEIGTSFGGSLQAISKYSEHVYSIDIDPDIPKRLQGRFPNVTFLTGASAVVLPPLIERLNRERAEVGFVLVDGDHSTDGVRNDIDTVLAIEPRCALYVAMHDSFNQECRAGLKLAALDENPYVHAVELDFVPGRVNPMPAFRGQLWGGIAVSILSPDLRVGNLSITERSGLTFSTCHAATLKKQRSAIVFARRVAARLRRAITRGGGARPRHRLPSQHDTCFGEF